MAIGSMGIIGGFLREYSPTIGTLMLMMGFVGVWICLAVGWFMEHEMKYREWKKASTQAKEGNQEVRNEGHDENVKGPSRLLQKAKD